MKGAILRKLNKPLSIENLTVPKPRVGQVLVEVKASGICGKQLGEISGHYGEDKYLPHLMGHEGAGIVKAIGPGVRHIKEGQHVVMHWRKGIGIDAEPAKYLDENIDIVGSGQVVTLCTEAVVSENRLTPIPDDIPFYVGALMGCSLTTGFGIVNNEAQLKMGQSILVLGCGGVGLSVILGASLVSAGKIIAVDKFASKLLRATTIGATQVYNTSNISDGLGLFNIDKVDVVVDTTGSEVMINNAIRCCKDNGKVILAGPPCADKDIRMHNFSLAYTGKQVIFSQGGQTNPTVDIPRYAELYTKGTLVTHRLISHIYDLDKINSAIDTMKTGTTAKCIIMM